jgi:hypothetical protein
VPATVSEDGRVFAAGTFSFQVTCQFDFSDYPYDVQECPIVLADWMFVSFNKSPLYYLL